MKLSMDAELMNFLRSGVVKTIKIVAADAENGESGTCEECKKLNGRVIPIKEAIELKLLPCKKCSFEANKAGVGWCRCRYLPEHISVH